MTDMTELDAAWAEAPTRLIAAQLEQIAPDIEHPAYIADALIPAAAARLRDLDALVSRAEIEAACPILDAPAPVAAPAGDLIARDVVTEEMARAAWAQWKGDGYAASAILAALAVAPAATAPAVAPEPPAAVVPWSRKVTADDITDEQVLAYWMGRECDPGTLSLYHKPRIAAGIAAAINAAPPPPPFVLTDEAVERACAKVNHIVEFVGPRISLEDMRAAINAALGVTP